MYPSCGTVRSSLRHANQRGRLSAREIDGEHKRRKKRGNLVMTMNKRSLESKEELLYDLSFQQLSRKKPNASQETTGRENQDQGGAAVAGDRGCFIFFDAVKDP